MNVYLKPAGMLLFPLSHPVRNLLITYYLKSTRKRDDFPSALNWNSDTVKNCVLVLYEAVV